MSCGCTCDNCEFCLGPPPAGAITLLTAVTELHNQSHPGVDVSLCSQEPCRWLTQDQLRPTT